MKGLKKNPLSVCAGFFLLLAMELSSCQSPQPVAEAPKLKTFSSDVLHPSSNPPMCKALLDSYCNVLYAPDASGNLEIKRSTSSIKILQGDTHNQLSQVFYRYSSAKVRNQNYFPKDFYRVLSRASYFHKLEEFLNRKPVETMSLSERLEVEQEDYELATIWSAAINETVILRMSRKYPGFHKLPDKLVPLELSLDESRIRRELISDISKAIWKDDENWKKVESTFLGLQKSYLNVIQQLDAPEELKNDWIKRIQEVRLVLPGSMPAISNDECSAVTANAFYYTYLNVITVCAGDFNSEDILQTLAHEMGHALDVDRTQYLYQMRSKLGAELKALRANVCEPEAFSCENWKAFTGKFEGLLSSLDGFQAQLPEFQRCLKRRPTSKTLNSEDVERFASSISADRISQLASSDRFLRITKPMIPLPNGKSHKNSNYLNPCSYYLWSQGEEPLDDELTTLMFFTASYRCSDEPDTQKLRSSIETAKDMTFQILTKTLKLEGEFSSRSELESGGYASPPGERFADVVGSYAMADYLAQLPYQWERRNKFLAGSSWLCREPSLASRYPEESSIEKEFVFNAHTEGEQRRKEIFSTPIRQVIECEKDFQFNECVLPLHHSSAK